MLQINGETVMPVQKMTKTAYDALATKDPNVLYAITGP